MDAVIIDYGGGNVRSVMNALKFLGIKGTLSASPKVIEKAPRLILPGQGHFGVLVNRLEKLNLISSIRKAAATKPVLGICVGMQIFLEGSDEAPDVAGFGFFRGRARCLHKGVKLPHMGWNTVYSKKGNALIPHGDYYFAHSYYCDIQEADCIAATTEYGQWYPSAIQREHLLGVQFHPEKSGEIGLQLLKFFFEGFPC